MARCSARVVLFGLLLVVLAGWASSPAVESDGPVAECSVCRENGDLACLKVRVTDATPRADYGGRTYYFCSDECREAFLKSPSKFAAK